MHNDVLLRRVITSVQPCLIASASIPLLFG